MPAMLVIGALATLSPLFDQIAPHAVSVSPARPAVIGARWGGKPVAVRIASVALHGCGRGPRLYGVTANAEDRCSRLARLTVSLDGAPLAVPTRAFDNLGDIELAEVRTAGKLFALDLRGAQGGAEDYGVTLTFDRRGLVDRRIYWPDGSAETARFTGAR